MLNALRIDTKTNKIKLGAGATGVFRVDVPDQNHTMLDISKDIGLFILCKENGEQHSKYDTVFSKTIIPQETDSGYVFLVDFANEDTRELELGIYSWNLTIVTDPVYDTNGLPICDERSDNVYPIFTGELPKFMLEGVGHIV